jgi:hypothetical protein
MKGIRLPAPRSAETAAQTSKVRRKSAVFQSFPLSFLDSSLRRGVESEHGISVAPTSAHEGEKSRRAQPLAYIAG